LPTPLSIHIRIFYGQQERSFGDGGGRLVFTMKVMVIGDDGATVVTDLGWRWGLRARKREFQFLICIDEAVDFRPFI
jgi:hypothetical protein